MSADVAHDRQSGVADGAARRSWRVPVVLGLGPVVSLAGLAWALVQPWRVTLLSPHGQGFWWLLAEPPLYVVLVGLFFRLVVAPGLVEDLEE